MFEGNNTSLSKMNTEPVDFGQHEQAFRELEGQIGGLEAAEYTIYVSHMLSGGALGTNDYVVNEDASARTFKVLSTVC